MNMNSIGNGYPKFSKPVMDDDLKAGKKNPIENRVKKEEASERKLLKDVKNLKSKEQVSDSKITFSKDGDILELSESSVSNYEKKIKEKDESDRIPEENKKSEEVRERMKESELKKEELKEHTKSLEKKVEARTELLRLHLEETNVDKEQTEISFTGKSESDIARMYLKGDISKAEYDREIESRENERKRSMQKEEKFMGEILHGAYEFEEMAKFEKELKLAFSESASEKNSPSDRFQVIEAALGERKKEGEKEVKIAVS